MYFASPIVNLGYLSKDTLIVVKRIVTIEDEIYIELYNNKLYPIEFFSLFSSLMNLN